MNEDKNKIELLLITSYVLKITKLVIIILNFSYILAMLWYIMCTLKEDSDGVDYKNPEDAADNQDTFIVKYGLEYKNQEEITIILTYFLFTSLATVGFGDYVPRSNLERVVGGLMLLIGVAVFSYIMGCFIEILNNFKSYNDDFQED
jgi:potassium voltage-gated channel Eag-related subfamily H protein 8